MPTSPPFPLPSSLAKQVEWKAGREISEALLERFLEAEEASPSAADAPGFPYLLSLHAFAVTDVQLCIPAKDPAKFVRSLAPYLKVGGGGTKPTPEQQRRGAEALLSILSVLDGVLSQLSGGVEAATLGELVADLAALVNRHPFVQAREGVGSVGGWT